MNYFLNETIFKPRIRRKREQNYDCILSCFFLLADKVGFLFFAFISNPIWEGFLFSAV
jgi:hypothetical protein